MRNRNFTACLRTRRPGIYLDASLNKLGCKIYDGRKTKGEQAGLTNRLFPECGGAEGKTQSWHRARSPQQREKSTVQIV